MPHVLKELICSLLDLKPSEIKTIQITNPILPGKALDMKEFVLDVHVLLNNNALINLEMQVINEQNGPERSLSYLCRLFDQLGRGQNYIDCKPAIHIGFLDFSPFPEFPEFYATYMLQNIKNHNLYSDKFVLSVVDLTHIELAIGKDKACGIDHWARLFKATTWEDLKMIAKNNPFLTEASETLYKLNADQLTRERCRAREDFIARPNALDRKLQQLSEEKQALISEIDQLRTRLAQYENLDSDSSD